MAAAVSFSVLTAFIWYETQTNSQILVIMVMIRFQNFIQLPESRQTEIITNPIDVKYIVPNTPEVSQIFITGKMHY